MAEYSTTGCIPDEQRTYGFKTKPDSKIDKQVKVLKKLYWEFKERREAKGHLEEDDLKDIYNHYGSEMRDAELYIPWYFHAESHKAYYISSQPFRDINKNTCVELICLHCGKGITSQLKRGLMVCQCQYEKYEIPKKIEYLKQTDESYLRFHTKTIGKSTYFIKDIVFQPYGGSTYTPHYVIECLVCGKQKFKDVSTFKRDFNEYGEHNLFSQRPFCDCNEHIKTTETRHKEKIEELEAKFTQVEWYVKGSLNYLLSSRGRGDWIIRYSYKCKICGDLIENVTLHDENPNWTCHSCTSSETGKETIKSALSALCDDYIPWSDEEYFNEYILNNSDFFPYCFMAIDFLPGIYRNNGNKVYKFKCLDCGYESEHAAPNIYTGGLKHCQNCGDKSESYGVQQIKGFLDDNRIEFEQEYRDEGCRNIKVLPFDLRILSPNSKGYQKVLIEFDGEQHERGWSGDPFSLQKTQYRDYLKNEFCYLNEYLLLRIPHYLNSRHDISRILSLFLQWAGVKDFGIDPATKIERGTTVLDYIIHKDCVSGNLMQEFIKESEERNRWWWRLSQQQQQQPTQEQSAATLGPNPKAVEF